MSRDDQSEGPGARPRSYRNGRYYLVLVDADADADVLVYHYYADNGAALLGLNLIGYDAAGWPYVY